MNRPILVRSKNAGPFTLTVDVMYADPADAVALYERLTSGDLVPRLGPVAGLPVQVHLDRTAAAVKISAARAIPAGSRDDLDLYGCQQHVGILEALGLP